MKRLRLLGIGLCIVLITVVSHVYAQATLKLPTDIIFEAWTDANDSTSVLVRIDAQTQKMSFFYGRPNSSIHILSWSPKGNVLAALVNSSQICILTRAGQFVSCMDGGVNVGDSGSGVGGDSDWYTISWSDDEKKLYYITDAGDTEHLVEGDVATGKTLRTLYDKPDMDPYTAMPGPNGIDLLLRNGAPVGSNSVDLVRFSGANGTSSHLSLNTALQAPFNKPVNVNIHGESAHDLVFCPFSPKGTYFTAYDVGGGSADGVIAYEFDVFDTNGHIAHQLRYETNPILPTEECPGWSPDESTLFFRVYVPSASDSTDYVAEIYSYTLGTSNIAPYYNTPDGLSFSDSPFQVSPDGQYLLYAAGYDTRLATVIGPNNTIATFSGPFNGNSSHPFWVPPLQP